MKSSRKWALGLVAATALLLKADIADYLRNLEASNSIQEVFFRLVPVGSVAVRMRRPRPRPSRPSPIASAASRPKPNSTPTAPGSPNAL